jgi:hypothetical protein
MNILDEFSKNNQISNFMKLRPVGAELFHADRRRDRHDEANSRFSQFCERAKKCSRKINLHIFKHTDMWLYIIKLCNVHTIANSHSLSSGLFTTFTSRSRWCYVLLKRNGVQYCEITGVCIYHWTRSCYSRKGFTKRVTIYINVCTATTNFSLARCIYAHVMMKTDINSFFLWLIHVAPRNTSKKVAGDASESEKYNWREFE